MDVLAYQELLTVESPSIIVTENALGLMLKHLERGSWSYGSYEIPAGKKEIISISIHAQRTGCLAGFFDHYGEACNYCKEILLQTDFRVKLKPPPDVKDTEQTAEICILWCPKCDAIYYTSSYLI